MKKEFLISVIIPVYNVEQYLEKCLDSVLNQTYKNLQIILVDDGSTDKSGMLCDNYKKRDERIEVIHKCNGGSVRARNDGLKLAKGQYVGFVDGDDWIESVMYEEMLENLLQTGAEYVHTGAMYDTEEYSKVDCRFETKIIDNPRMDIELWEGIIGVHENIYLNRGITSKLFKKELITDCYSIVPEEQCFGEDYISVVGCILKSRRISLLKKAYYHHVTREGSYVNTFNGKKLIWIAKMYEQIMLLLEKYDLLEQLNPYLERMMAKDLITVVNKSSLYKAHIPCFRLKYLNDFLGKRIILYGAGGVGYDYYLQLSKCQSIQIVEWIDQNPYKYNYQEREVHKVEAIFELEYDWIIVAVQLESVFNQIKESLRKKSIDINKVYWVKPDRLI